MSLEVFEKLEAKVQQAIDTITLFADGNRRAERKKQLTVAGSSKCPASSAKSWSVRTTI